MPVSFVLAMFAYLFCLGLVIPSVLRKKSAYPRLALCAATFALGCHTLALKHQIFHIEGAQNLTLLNITSTVGLIICSIMTVVAARGRGWFLLPIVYSFAMVNLACASLLPGEFVTHLKGSPALLVHIGLALFAYATLIIAMLYALQLAWIDYLLKNKKLTFTIDMPPLMSIERHMLHITQAGVLLLTLTLITGALFYLDKLFHKENIHKALLSMLAWSVYITLLWGHHYVGWRGRHILWFSLLGAFLLTVAYFGQRLI